MRFRFAERGSVFTEQTRRSVDKPRVIASSWTEPPTIRSMPKSAALIQIHLSTLLAGLTGLFGKFLDASPLLITGGRTLVGGLALFAAARSTRVSLRVRSWKDGAFFALSGALLAIHWLTFFQAIQVSTVATGLLALSSFPLFVTFLEPFFFQDRLRPLDIALAGMVIAGIFVMTPHFDSSNRITQGVLWGTGSAVALSFFCLLARTHVSSYPPIAVTFYQQSFASAFSLPALLIFPQPITLKTAALIILLGLIFTALAQCLFIAGLRNVRAQTASMITALEPVYGIVFAIFLLGEIPPARTLLGGALICGAVFAATYTHSRNSPSPEILERL